VLRALDEAESFRFDHLKVERRLIEAQLMDAESANVSERLQEALRLSHNLGTLYQRCEILIALTSVHLELNEREQARDYIKQALDLARENHYGILAAQAQLLSGVASDDSREKQPFLSDALQAASEMGLQELVAEAAYHLGALNLKSGNMVTAREYLIRSTTLTARIAQGVPNRARSKYLAKTWRRDALRALDQCNDALPLQTAGLFNSSDSDRYFAAIYRFTMATQAATSMQGLFGSIERILSSSLNRSAAITIKHPAASQMIPIKLKFSPELLSRMERMNMDAKNHLLLESVDAKSKQASAWIPLNGETYSGGIYVACRLNEPPFSEQEIELFTMIGTIASAALKRLETFQAQKSEPQELTGFHGIVGDSKPIREIHSQIRMASGNVATVLIEGESGTGKELVARAIHAAGPRRKERFIAVDCGSIPETLIEAELFGAKKGSYTGAVTDRAGLFESAHRGTIFLDEISNTTPALQAKLLRVIQEREVRRLGETSGRHIDVRLIVASNQDLEKLVNTGQFRKDLFYRLKVLHITLPPLRDRRDDIPMLAHTFLKKLNVSNKTKKYFAPNVVENLMLLQFPGNVRELQNAVERAFFLAKGFMITEIPIQPDNAATSAPADEIQVWFKELSEGQKDFWSAVHNRYKRRDISREKVVALVDFGLRSTRGNYKTMASMFRMKPKDYRRFMDFLRRNDCLLDFRPYRKAAVAFRES